MPPASSLRWCAARLTNHAELVRELGLPDAASDRDVVVAAVERWGDATAAHLRGAFAYAVAGPAGEITITRDAVGVMPAFWTRDGSGALHVSDSLAVLHAVDGVDLAPDAEFEAAFVLRAAGLLHTRTGTVGIHRVPSGSTTTITRDGARTTRWWQPEHAPVVRGITVDAAAAELRDLLLRAVDDELATILRRSTPDALHGGIATHLSGGLDSAAVTYLASDALARRRRCLDLVVSWSPDPASVARATDDDDLAYDERDVIDGLARDLGVPVWYGPAEMSEAPWLAALDAAVFPRETVERESFAAPAVAALDVGHVLSGWGGDEFASFNGRGTNRAIVRRIRIGPLRDAYRDRRRRGFGRPGAVWATVKPGLPAWVRVERAPDTPSAQRARQRLADASAAFPDLARTYEAQQQTFARAPDARAYQLALIHNGHLGRRIDAWHQIALNVGIEYHYPLLDRRIVEWALSMPPEVYRDGGHSRRVFRLAVAGIVPDAIRITTKDDPVLLSLVRDERERRRADAPT